VDNSHSWLIVTADAINPTAAMVITVARRIDLFNYIAIIKNKSNVSLSILQKISSNSNFLIYRIFCARNWAYEDTSLNLLHLQYGRLEHDS
jgi:hypothetical protein